MKHLCIIIALASFSLYGQINEAIKFKITDNYGNTDEMILRLKDEATSSFDPEWDAWKFFSPFATNPSIYSNNSSAYPLAINSFPQLSKDTVVYLILRAQVNEGIYNLTSEQLGLAASDLKIALRDIVSGEIYELNENISHDFPVVSDANSDQIRFEVFYSPRATAEVYENTLTVSNNGCFDWDFKLLDASEDEIDSGTNFSESLLLDNLMPGEYKITVTDKYFLTDTLAFQIIYEDTAVVVDDSTVTETSSIRIENHPLNHVVYASQSTIYIELDPSGGLYSSIRVYDMRGNIIHYQANPKLISSLELNVDNQLIFLEIISTQNVKSIKKLMH
jgi:hypothetical protein